MEDDMRSNIWIVFSEYPKYETTSEHKTMPFYNSGSYGSQIPRTIVELHHLVFVGCSFGCLVMEDQDMDETILIDLRSMQLWYLSSIGHEYQQALLTSTPTEPECRVLFHDNRTIMFCGPNDTQVERRDFTDDDMLDKNDLLCPPVLYQGQVYCICFTENRLFRVQFTCSDSCSKIQLVQVAEALPPYYRGCRAYRLVELGGDLLLVEIIYTSSYRVNQVYDFKIYKLEVERRIWGEVNGIGDYAILYSTRHTSAVYAPHYQMKKNSIYYFVRNDLNLYVFNLDDGGITKCLPHPDAAIDSNSADVQWLTLPAPIKGVFV